MKRLISAFIFYRKPLMLSIGINLILFLFPGSYFEEYEGIFSSFVHGTYTFPCIKEWNTDTHFLLFSLYAYINSFFSGIQIYGIVLTINTLISLTCLGLLLYRIFLINIGKFNISLFVLMYVIYSVDNIVNLNTDRFLFTDAIIVFGYIESRRLEGKKMLYYHWIIISVACVYMSFIRMEAVILSAAFYIGILIIHKRVYKLAFLPLLISSIVFLSYNIIMTYHMSEARQVYYYKEIDFLTRGNINHESLTPRDSADVFGFFDGVTDKEHFTMDFYNRISYFGGRHGMHNLFNGLKPLALFGAFLGSLNEMKLSFGYILFSFLSVLLLIFSGRYKGRVWAFHMIWLFFFPFLIYIYTFTPARFLIPFYAFTGICNSLIYLKNSPKTKFLYFLLIFIFCISGTHALYARNRYLQLNDRFIQHQEWLTSLNKNKRFLKPVIICGFDINKFYPVKPLQKIVRQNALFLNFYYFNSYDCYIDAWAQACNCNALSLEEKIDYIVSEGNYCVIDDRMFNNIRRYYSFKYHKNLVKQDTISFDRSFKVCKFNYSNH